MTEYKRLNIVNAAAMTDWFKEITWGNDTTQIRFADIKRRDFVGQNADAVAKMMAHSYIKKNILYYFNPYVDSEILTPVPDTPELSDAVRAAIAAGYPAYNFHPDRVTPKIRGEITRLNNYLHNAALKYINQQVAQNSDEFTLNIKQLDTEFPDVMAVVRRSKFMVQMPELPRESGHSVMQMQMGREKD